MPLVPADAPASVPISSDVPVDLEAQASGLTLPLVGDEAPCP